MNPQELEVYRELLLKRRLEILDDSDQDEDIRDAQRTGSADPLDMALDTESMELMMALGDSERRELKEIERALEKIENDTYGVCELCGGEIGAARLEAIPTADLCISCKSSQERNSPVSYTRRRWRPNLNEEMSNTDDKEDES